MNQQGKIVDGFKFMPRSLRAWVGKSIPDSEFTGHIPWTPMKKNCAESSFALLTSAGISMKSDPDFDMEREKREPLWGDPTYRTIPRDAAQADIHVNHLHVNNRYILEDINVMLPINRFAEFEAEGIIRRLAPTHYSIYGYQLNPSEWMNTTLPAIAARMGEEDVDAVVLTPS